MFFLKWMICFLGLFYACYGQSYPRILSYGTSSVPGLLGRTEGEINRPGLVVGFEGKTIKQISCGKSHNLVLLDDGLVYSFGDPSQSGIENLLGRSGDPSLPSPVNMSSVTGTIKQVEAGYFASFLLTTAGKVYSFGEAPFIGRSNVSQNIPQLIGNIPSNVIIKDISSKWTCSLLLTDDGKVYSFGSDSFPIGRSGNLLLPDLITGIPPMRSIASGFFICALLSESGIIYTFGSEENLALSRTGDSSIPLPIQNAEAMSGENLIEVSAGSHILARTANGKVYSWGSSLPVTGRSTNSSFPDQITYLISNKNIIKIEAGWFSNILIDSDGVAYSFGIFTGREIKCGNSLPFPFLIGETFVEASVGDSHVFLLSSSSASIPQDPSVPACPLDTIPPTDTSSRNRQKGENTTGIILGVVFGNLILIALLFGLFFYYYKKKHKKQKEENHKIELSPTPDSETLKPIPSNQIEINQLIGSGNFGMVFRGTWNGTDVALKRLNDPSHFKEFLDEAKILRKLTSFINVVRLLGIYTDDKGMKYIVTEYLSGGNLESFLRHHTISSEQIVRLCIQIAAGMMNLHQVGILHRDLSARNILVGEEGGIYTAKISDFGLSRKVKDDFYSSTAIELPVKWTAPESLEYRTYTSKSDVWSYGIVCWECFSHGAVPYPDLLNHQVRPKILEGYRLPKPDDCPEEIYKLMLRCWMLNPKDRPNFSDIYQELSKFAEVNYSNQKKEKDQSPTFFIH